MKKLFIPIIFLFASTASFAIEAFNVKISGQGPDIILIPGLSSSGEVWDSTVSQLKHKYRLHVFTLAGFAGQPTKVVDHFLPTMRDSIIRYIKQNNLITPVIIGHSIGGFLGLQISIKEPKIASKLIVVDAFPFWAAVMLPGSTETTVVPMASNMKNQMQKQTDEQYKKMAPRMLSSLVSSAKDVQTLLKWGLKTDRRVAGEAMYELLTTDLRQQISRINIPTLVLGSWVAQKNYGVTHEMQLANFKKQYSRLKAVKILLSDKSRHFIMYDDPAFFFKAINDFLQ